MTKDFLFRLGQKIVPIKYLTELTFSFNKAGIAHIPFHFVGSLFVFNILLLLVLGIIFLEAVLSSLIFSLFISMILFVIIIFLEVLVTYIYLDIRTFNRVKEMESHLDRFLQQVSDNLKGGMIFNRALWSSAKPEFGPLSDEIKMIARVSTTGKDLESALYQFIDKFKIDSPTLTRTFSLIAESIKMGGKITDILDKIVIDLRESRRLNREMSTAVLNYIIFISLIVTIIAPGLFAISGQLLQILTKFIASLASSFGGSGSPMAFSVSPITTSPEDFRTFAMSSLGVINLFSAMIISTIVKGNIKGGLKYLLPFLLVSLSLYNFFAQSLSYVFSSFI